MSARARAELDLFLVARLPSGLRRAVSVRVSPAMPVAELTERLARHFGLDPRGLRLYAPGGQVPVGGEVRSLGLRMGDELWLVPESFGRATAATSGLSPWELVVVGGPQAGRRLRLPNGEQVLGRTRDAAVRLDDRGLSRVHLKLRVDADGVVLVPAGQHAATYLDGRPLPPEHRLAVGQVVEAGHSLLAVRSLAGAQQRQPRAVNGRIAFNRPPAPLPCPAPGTVRLPEAPAEPVRLRVPVAASLAPVIFGLVAWVATRSAAVLLLALGAPAMALAPALEDRVIGRRQRQRQARRYRAKLAEAGAGLALTRRQEAEALRRRAPDPLDLEARASGVLPSLWERRPGQPEFLRLRLGWTDLPSEVGVEVPPLGRPDLRDEARSVAAASARLPNVPLTLDLAEVGAVGLAGPAQAVAGLGRWLVVQAAVLHSPRELGLAASISPRETAKWEWLGWLPHSRWGEGDGSPRARLVVAQEDGAITHAELAHLTSRPGEPTHLLWLGSTPHRAPEVCRALVEISDSGTRVLLRTPDKRRGQREVAGVPDLVPVDYAERVARSLSGVDDEAATAPGGGLPDSAGLLECLGLSDLGQANGDLAAAIVQRWSAAEGSLAAPVGVGTMGVVGLDLREHGPHALIGGTSGSGKSELMRAWVTGLAATHSPRRLNVLLVDFKGGTAFQDCARLPHVVGLVTDLSERLLERVRRSLLAELKRREAELARFGQKELVDLEREHPDAAPPALLVVFDEFEQLQAEHPAFVSDVIVPIARLGRGLGVHLLLGTQKPQGAVPETIRANANIRIALRMLSEAHSRDVIDAPDAAHLPPSERGRAFLRLSHQKLVPLQAAFARARSCDPTEPTVDSFPPCPKPSSSVEGEGRGGAPPQPNDFELVTAAIAGAAERLGMGPARRPWLPPLPDVLPLAQSIEAVPGEPGGGRTPSAPIGLVDEPRRQAQWPIAYTPALDGHLIAYGGAGSGKSTLLRTLACSLARVHSPGDLWLYGLDFSAGWLRALAALPHTGGIASADDPEMVAQVLRQLSSEAARRRRHIGEAGSNSLPTVVLLVDELDSFRSAFERVDGGRYLELLQGLIREGRAVSIYCALTTSARRDLAGPAATGIGRKLVLRPGREDREALGLSVEIGAAELPPGRGLVDSRLEFQVGVLADGSPDAEAEAVRRLGAELADRHRDATTARATAVVVLPDEVATAALPGAGGPLRAVLGLGGDLGVPIEIDLLGDGNLIVCGPRTSGRTTALVALTASLSQALTRQRLVLLSAGRRSKLEAEAAWWRVALGVDASGALAASLGAELAGAGEDCPPTAIVIDDGEMLFDGPGEAAQRTLARLGRDLPIRVIAALEVRAMRRYSEWVGTLRESRHALLLNPDVSSDGELFGLGPLPRPLRPWPPGRGYLVRRGRATLVQVAH